MLRVAQRILILVGSPVMFLFVLFDKADAVLSRGSNCAFHPYRISKIADRVFEC